MKKHHDLHKKAIDWELAYCFRGSVNDYHGREHDSMAGRHSPEAAGEYILPATWRQRKKKTGFGMGFGKLKATFINAPPPTRAFPLIFPNIVPPTRD